MDSEAQISTTLICPICGKSGTALWDGSASSAPANGAGHPLVSVSSGFERGQETDRSGGAEILCSTCSVSVPN
jgi:hypothetical protein